MRVVLVGVAVSLFATLIGAGFLARHRLRRRPTGDAADSVPRGWVLRFVRPYRAPLGIGVGLILIHTLVDLAAPWPLKVMVDNAINGEPLPGWLAALDPLSPTQLAFVAAFSALGLVLLSVVITYLVTVLIGSTEVRIASDIRAAVFRRLQDLSLGFHDRNRTGDLVSRLTVDVERVRDVIVVWFDSVLPDVLVLVGILIVMSLVDATLTILAVSVAPLLLYYAFLKRPRIRAAQRLAQDQHGVMASQATDTLRNVRVVQSFSRQADETERFTHQLDRAAEADIDSLDVSARYAPISTVVLAIGTALVSWIGVTKVIDGELSLGTLLVFLAYLGNLYRPIRSLSRNVALFARGAASRDRLTELFTDEHVIREHAAAVDASTTDTRLSVRNVHFAYEPDTPVLGNVTLSLPPGSSVCVVGASGAGKSTLLSLLLRLYEPSAGTIQLGGLDIRHLTIDSLRDRIALVPQDPWMMDGTIGENISFGQRRASGSQVLEAARLVGVDQFAEIQPLGYQTPVGEGGLLLSGGQRRRIALARALIRNSPILVLDEPTAGLDAESAHGVLEAVDAASTGRTLLVVSHDLAVATRTDQVVLLHDGAVAERGTHRRLLEAGGRYARMWKLQQQSRDLDNHDDREEVRAQ